jgi:hypothetical protein
MSVSFSRGLELKSCDCAAQIFVRLITNVLELVLGQLSFQDSLGGMNFSQHFKDSGLGRLVEI